jgi:predicted nuclease of predicted toxin-antitoxin system
MKILIDMNLAFRWAQILSNRGISAVHWNTVGAVTAPDSEIMSYAKAHNYAILTRDLDFGDILAYTKASAPSVIQIRAFDARPEQIFEAVFDALTRLKSEVEQGALVTIDIKKTRIRILPFH